jgi:tripartite-type tricarboxylate transporter receptor subunit TctC
MKTLLRHLAATLLVAASIGPAAAQSDWPQKPIHWIVPFPAGGQAEIISRVIADKIAPVLGQPVLVEAKPGAGGNLGTEQVAKSAPDGYTWLSSGVPLTTAPAMYPDSLPFDPIKSFEAVAKFGSTPFVIAIPAALPVSNLAEFIDYTKKHKGQMSYAGSGIGSLVHLASEMFKLQASIDMTLIPYNGQPPAIADLLANRVQFMVLGLSLAKPLLDSKQIKALAILDDHRSKDLPDLPTVAEAGYPKLTLSGWAGLQMPKGTPKAIVDKVNKAVMDAMADPEIVTQMTKLGWQPVQKNSPKEFEDFVRNEIEIWRQVVKDAKIETL